MLRHVKYSITFLQLADLLQTLQVTLVDDEPMTLIKKEK